MNRTISNKRRYMRIFSIIWFWIMFFLMYGKGYAQCERIDRTFTMKVLDIYETEDCYMILGSSDTLLVMIVSKKDKHQNEQDRCQKIKIGEIYKIKYQYVKKVNNLSMFKKYLFLGDLMLYEIEWREVKSGTGQCMVPLLINCIYYVPEIKGIRRCD